MMSRNVIKFCYRNINKTVGLEGKAGYPERAVTVGLQFVYNCKIRLIYVALCDIISSVRSFDRLPLTEERAGRANHTKLFRIFIKEDLRL